MSRSTNQEVFREEFTTFYKKHKSHLRHTFVKDDDSEQYSCQLKKYLIKVILCGNLVTTSRHREKIWECLVRKINRKRNKVIFDTLDSGTLELDCSSIKEGPLERTLQNKITKLVNSADGQKWPTIWGVISPAFRQKMRIFNDGSKVDPINDDRFPKDKDRYFIWEGVRWIVHSSVPGAGENMTTCYLYTGTAVDHALKMDIEVLNAGYNEENDYSYACITVFMGGQLLQNSGVIKIYHDDTTVTGQHQY